jgi:hypothetical protein
VKPTTAESIGWQPLGDGAYPHIGNPEGDVVTVVGVPEVGMAGMNVLWVGWFFCRSCLSISECLWTLLWRLPGFRLPVPYSQVLWLLALQLGTGNAGSIKSSLPSSSKQLVATLPFCPRLRSCTSSALKMWTMCRES